MSIFGDNTSEQTLQKEGDRLVRENYRVSASGKTLIPILKSKDGLWGVVRWSKPGKNPLPYKKGPIDQTGCYHEENSILNMFAQSHFNGNKSYAEMYDKVYNLFIPIIRGMGLSCIVYNQKRYYCINRAQKKVLFAELCKVINS